MSEIGIYECQAGAIDVRLRQLWISSIQEGSISILPSEENSNKWIRFVRESLTKGRSLLLVARAGGVTVGYLLANISGDFLFDVSERFCMISDLFVVPEFRRNGIGKRLVLECMKKTKAKGFASVRLNVLPENEVAIKLYQKLGFRIFMYGMTGNLM
jgi:ribosomal protein S18 acetylase RimI-like enzyme